VERRKNQRTINVSDIFSLLGMAEAGAAQGQVPPDIASQLHQARLALAQGGSSQSSTIQTPQLPMMQTPQLPQSPMMQALSAQSPRLQAQLPPPPMTQARMPMPPTMQTPMAQSPRMQTPQLPQSPMMQTLLA
jgi:hypothetical protein